MRRFLFAVVALAPGGLADAQSAKDLRFSSEVVSDEMATKTLGVVVANISMARDERGENLRPLTPEEASSPPLDIAFVKEIMDVARASAAGQASAEQRVGVEAFYTAKWPETH